MREIWSKIYIGPVKYPLFLSDFNGICIFLASFSKNTQISNFIKIHSLGAELFHADRRIDGRTDMTKLTVAFRNFARTSYLRSLCHTWAMARPSKKKKNTRNLWMEVTWEQTGKQRYCGGRGRANRGGSVTLNKQHLIHWIWFDVFSHRSVLEKHRWVFGFCYQKNDPPHTKRGNKYRSLIVQSVE